MLEAKIEIPDELAAKGFRRAMDTKSAVEITAYYGQSLAVVWILIVVVDGLMGAGHLIPYHLLALLGLWAFASIRRYRDWSRQVAGMKGWSFLARLDEVGVTTVTDGLSDERRWDWSYYKNYVEYDTYLQIENENGDFSFLPKTPELFEIIEFTKRKIPER